MAQAQPATEPATTIDAALLEAARADIVTDLETLGLGVGRQVAVTVRPDDVHVLPAG